tara:strand:+ start:244 stop:696 length:453 start_codon:yes stop_codon:yes gene_type:complete
MKIHHKSAEKDATLIGQEHPSLPGYKLAVKNKDRSRYIKTNPFTLEGSYLEFNHATKQMTAGKVLPDVVAQAAVKLNKQKQNNFDGYKNKTMVQEYAVPGMIMQQIKEASGLEHRTGLYDEQKAKAILDDPDYRYLKSVPHKISNRKREI